MADKYGTGGTAAFTTSSTTLNGKITQIQVASNELPTVDDTALETTTNMEYLPGDLVAPERVTFQFKVDSDTALPALGTVETGTITYKQLSGQATAATFAGTGFLVKVGQPDHLQNELLTGEGIFQFDGKTGPTHTAAT